MLASKRNGTRYLGVTSDIARRVSEHKSGVVEGITKTYGVHRLVHVEFHEQMGAAIRREKQIKTWRRESKIRLIEENNPRWRDLFADILR